MTRLRRLVFLGAAVTTMFMPRAASAQGGLIDFIESLSGPGPYRGGGFVWRLACMRTADRAFRGTSENPWKVASCLNDEDVRVRGGIAERVRQIVEVRGLWATTPEGHR